MSDMWHDRVPDSFIRAIFRVMNDTPQHTYQILTKRPDVRLTGLAMTPISGWAPASRMNTLCTASLQSDVVRPKRASSVPNRYWVLCQLLISLASIGSQWAARAGWYSERWIWLGQRYPGCVRRATCRIFFKQDSAPRTEVRPYLVELMAHVGSGISSLANCPRQSRFQPSFRQALTFTHYASGGRCEMSTILEAVPIEVPAEAVLERQ